MKMIFCGIIVIVINIAFISLLISEQKKLNHELGSYKKALETMVEPQTKITAFITTIDPVSMEINSKQMEIDLSKNSVYKFSPEYIIKEVTLIRQ